MGRGIENGRASCAVHPLPRTETRENGGSGAISIPRVGFIGFPNSPFDKKKKKKKFGSYSAPSTLFRESKKKKKKPLKARHICHCEARKSLTIGGADLFCYGRYIYIYFSFSYRGTRIDRHYYLNDRFTSEKILGIRANIRIYISPVSFNSIEDTAFATRQLFFYVFDIIFRYNRSIQYN